MLILERRQIIDEAAQNARLRLGTVLLKDGKVSLKLRDIVVPGR
ncbi:MAG: hypothetical protein ABI142_06670 [Bryocella sp.]